MFGFAEIRNLAKVRLSLGWVPDDLVQTKSDQGDLNRRLFEAREVTTKANRESGKFLLVVMCEACGHRRDRIGD
ncbi:hypothetical protein [Burkholderia sp. CQ001]|uniref:hypothetical protein n=1 Tax=Burkholderia sp. CQ001 TaxID=1836045 RepID=UPI00114CF37E|nr:hypothetical protein [Burkholderia sp. CQ001]